MKAATIMDMGTIITVMTMGMSTTMATTMANMERASRIRTT
jgi:hypothetical protein